MVLKNSVNVFNLLYINSQFCIKIFKFGDRKMNLVNFRIRVQFYNNYVEYFQNRKILNRKVLQLLISSL